MNITYITRSATIVKRLAYLIAAVGTIASYGTQVELLKGWDVGAFSYVIPATIDLLAICAAIALQIPGFPTKDRKVAAYILITAVVVSIAANVTAGHNLGARLAHAWPVIAYLLAELIANRIRQYVAVLKETEKASQIVAEPLNVAATAVATRGHANCSHEATRTARALCRRNS
jgi:hypothetical protein